MVQVSKQINGGDKMDECFKQRKLLADEFKKYQKVFVALGDENRQNIFFVLLENDKVGMIVFAGDAFTQLPITSDYISAKMFWNLSTRH